MEERLFFASYETLWRDVRALAARLPEVDAVMGVPRSGVLPAAMLATMLHKRLAAAYSEAKILEWTAGARLVGRAESHPVRTILLVEDASYAASFVNRWNWLRDMAEVVTACIYGGPETAARVDYLGRLAERPRVFTWNLLNNSLTKSFCVDIDGVLCPDPPLEADDDAWARRWIDHADPLMRCTTPIHSVVTSRLEKYRSRTEAWLRRQGIACEHLVMAPDVSAQGRRRRNRNAEDKADYYASTGCHAFIESDDGQARRIAELTGRPVICVGSDKGYNVRT